MKIICSYLTLIDQHHGWIMSHPNVHPITQNLTAHFFEKEKNMYVEIAAFGAVSTHFWLALAQ